MDTELYKLAEFIIASAKIRGLTIATAESCTGGWIAKCLTDIPGSSSVYKGSIVAYANEIKDNLLGLPKDIMIEHGAVSDQTAGEMAKNCAQSFGVDLALSVTGIAGPGGGTTEKPVGLVFMGLYFLGEVTTLEFRFANSGREEIRHKAVLKGLALIENACRNSNSRT